MELIDKDKIVAEIEKLISNGKLKCQQSQENNDQVSYIAWSEHIATCGKILSFLNTLETKEIDIEKEVADWWNKYYGGIKKNYTFEGYTGHYMENFTIISLAKHFYELGQLNVKKEE